MATPTATAIRQETAAARIAQAAAKLGITVPQETGARDPETKLADLLEWIAETLEQIAGAANVAPAEPTPKPARSKTV